MRVAALAPIAAMLVAAVNAAPVPVADPLSLCFFGFGIGCSPSTTSSVAAKTTSTVASSTVKASSTLVASTTTASSTVATSAASPSKASSSSVSRTSQASTTTANADWIWLWDPTYIFKMWNNFNTFRWERYNDCSFNGYSLTYVKAWYYQTYGFKPMSGCQWIDVHSFLAKYAVKTSIAPASTAKYTPGCANPFGGANANWKPTTSSSASSSASSTLKVTSTAAASISTPVVYKASTVAVSSSSALSSSQVTSSRAASSQAASSQAAQSSVAQSSVAQSSVAQSSVAQSSVAQSSVPQSSSSSTLSSAAQSSASEADSSSATETASASSATPSATPGSGIVGTPVTLSNGKVVQSIGCVAEIDGRKFKGASIDYPDVMTNEWCSNYCSNLGFPVSGTEYAKECYCADLDALNTYTISDQCVMPCSGDASGQSVCGGPQCMSTLVAPVSARTVALPTNWVSRGCYQDNSDRVLTFQAWSGNSTNTLESCAAQCASLGYNIAGAEYGSECFCGNAFVGGPVAIDSGSCSFSCPGNGDQRCGGSFALSVASLTTAF